MPDYAGKEEGMARAESGASDEWKAAASLTIQVVAKHHKEFTADEVWEALRLLNVPAPSEPRAMGPMMRNAAKSGVCSKTGYSKVSEQGNNHARPVAVWVSHVYAGVEPVQPSPKSGWAKIVGWFKGLKGIINS